MELCMNPDNLWCIWADRILWDEFEVKFAMCFLVI